MYLKLMAYAQINQYFIERLHLLTRNEIVVFTYLLYKRNGNSLKCNPRLATIAAETNLTAPRITEAVRGLEAKNWIIWLDSGDFVFNEKVTESVTSQVTNSVRKSYGKRNLKLRNAEVEVTQSVSEIKGIEQTLEQTFEQCAFSADTQKIPEPVETENVRCKSADEATEIFAEVFNFVLPIHTQTLLADERISAPELWRQILKDAKAGMTAGQLQSANYVGKQVQYALKDYRRAFQNQSKQLQITGEKTNGQFKSAYEKRDEAAIRDFQFIEQVRARVEARRAEASV